MDNSSPNKDKNDIGTGIGTRIVNLGSTNCDVISMRIVGQVIGAFCIFLYADWKGRKPALMITYNISLRFGLSIRISEHNSSICIWSVDWDWYWGRSGNHNSLYRRDITKVKAWQVYLDYIPNRDYQLQELFRTCYFKRVGYWE